MSRESKRDRARFERRAEQEGVGAEPSAEAAGAAVERKGRTGPRQYVGEVRSELRRVHWPDRKQLTQYSLVVLVAISLLTAYIFGIDQVFGQFVLWVFG